MNESQINLDKRNWDSFLAHPSSLSRAERTGVDPRISSAYRNRTVFCSSQIRPFEPGMIVYDSTRGV